MLGFVRDIVNIWKNHFKLIAKCTSHIIIVNFFISHSIPNRICNYQLTYLAQQTIMNNNMCCCYLDQHLLSLPDNTQQFQSDPMFLGYSWGIDEEAPVGSTEFPCVYFIANDQCFCYLCHWLNGASYLLRQPRPY